MTDERIARVDAYPLRYPEPNNDGKIRHVTLVRIETARWRRRLGRGDHRGRRSRPSRSRSWWSGGWRPSLIGRDPRDVRRPGRRCAMRRTGTATAASSRSASVPSTWRCGTSPARLAGLPLYGCWAASGATACAACAVHHLRHGGPRPGRPRVRGASSPRATGSSRVAGATTCRIAFGRDEARDLAIARTVREAIGPDAEIILDVVALRLGRQPRRSPMARALDDRTGCTGWRTRCPSRTSTATGGCTRPPDTRICTGEKGWHAARTSGAHRVGRARRRSWSTRARPRA